MSLKNFHVVFIIASLILCFGFAFWTYRAPEEIKSHSITLLGILSFVCGLALTGYLIYFFRFSKKVGTA